MFNYLLFAISIFLVVHFCRLDVAAADCNFKSEADDGKTVFIIKSEYEWNKEKDAAFPNQDPSITPGFKIMSCVSHNVNFTLWAPGGPTRREFKDFFTKAAMVETNQEDPFGSIVSFYMNNLYPNASNKYSSIGDYQPRDEDLRFDITVESEDNVNVTVEASNTNPYISCFAMIYPSSDWFVGVSKLNMCELQKSNISFVDGTLYAFDAGIYETLDYVTGDEDDREPEPNPFTRQVRVVAPRGFGTILIHDVNDSQSLAPNSTVACFPADEQVTLSSGKLMRMDKLSVDDHVLATSMPRMQTSSGLFPDSQSNSSRIIAFSHRDETIVSPFVRISYQFKDGTTNSIRLSPGHFIYRYSSAQSNSLDLVKASEIEVGNLLINAFSNDVLDHPTVFQLENLLGKGLFNPHSENGELIVGGIRVSCYTSALSPKVATAALSPIRFLSKFGLGPIGDLVTYYISSIGRLLKHSIGIRSKHI